MFQCRRWEREQEIASVWMSRHDGRVVPGWGGELGAKHESWKHFVKVWSVKGKPSILNTPALTHPRVPHFPTKRGRRRASEGNPTNFEPWKSQHLNISTRLPNTFLCVLQSCITALIWCKICRFPTLKATRLASCRCRYMGSRQAGAASTAVPAAGRQP